MLLCSPSRKTFSDGHPELSDGDAASVDFQMLDELPEGSSVTIPVEQYRDMVTRQLQLSALVASQRKLLEEHVSDY